MVVASLGVNKSKYFRSHKILAYTSSKLFFKIYFFPAVYAGLSLTHSSCIRIRGAGIDRNPCRSKHQAGIDAVHVQCHFMAAVARRSFAVHIGFKGIGVVKGLEVGVSVGAGVGAWSSCSHRRGRRSHSRWMSNGSLALCCCWFCLCRWRRCSGVRSAECPGHGHG